MSRIIIDKAICTERMRSEIPSMLGDQPEIFKCQEHGGALRRRAKKGRGIRCEMSYEEPERIQYSKKGRVMTSVHGGHIHPHF